MCLRLLLKLFDFTDAGATMVESSTAVLTGDVCGNEVVSSAVSANAIIAAGGGALGNWSIIERSGRGGSFSAVGTPCISTYGSVKQGDKVWGIGLLDSRGNCFTE